MILSVVFALNAVFSALWLTVDQRGANLITFSVAAPADAPSAAHLSALSRPELPDELAHATANPDSPTEHLIGVLSFDALEGESQPLPTAAWIQMRVLSQQWLDRTLPWTYLKGPMRPPRLLA